MLIISLWVFTFPSFSYCLQNTDAALLPCISYPAFALDDEALFSQTLDKVVRKLKGKYGFKRFLRDGYRTSLEDPNRRYYKPAEIKVSKNISYHNRVVKNTDLGNRLLGFELWLCQLLAIWPWAS